jgi:hypothetical protein
VAQISRSQVPALSLSCPRRPTLPQEMLEKLPKKHGVFCREKTVTKQKFYYRNFSCDRKKPNSPSASQDIFSFVIESERSLSCSQEPTIVLVLNQINPVHILPKHFLKVHFNFVLLSALICWKLSLPFRLSECIGSSTTLFHLTSPPPPLPPNLTYSLLILLMVRTDS